LIIKLDRGTKTLVLGPKGDLLAGCKAALVGAGGRMLGAENAGQCDVFVEILSPLPEKADINARTVLDRCETVANSMAGRRGGRIVLVVSALASIPMRTHRRYGQDMSAAVAGVRALAMQFGPDVNVNAVGLGFIENSGPISGDHAQLSHVPLGRPGNLQEAIAAVLFFCDPCNSYTSGQLLCVDGGWSAGYARDF
jgi:NAD(P)-dependent dehydrogenase (short-subunit alcohol dehydrogenase family)